MSYAPKILIVDDEPRMCDSLKALLSVQGYEMKTCNSGKEAIEYLNNNTLDLILLDMVMPDMNGCQIMDHINTQSPDTPVIVITGHGSMQSAIDSLRRRAYDYLKKPFNPDEMLTAVGNAIDYRRLKSENDKLNGELSLSKERHRYLVQNSPDIIYTLDDKENFTFISNAIEGLLNFKIDQLVGRHYSEIIHEEDLEKAEWFFNERRTGERAASGIELKLKICSNGDGSERGKVRYLTIELKATGMYGRSTSTEGKKFLGTHGVARDISDRKRLESQLQQAQKMEAIGTLAGGIAHDFNNILGVIVGHTDLAMYEIPEWHPARNNLEGIHKASFRAKDMVRQILSFSRQSEQGFRPVKIGPIIKESLKFLRSSIPTTIEIHHRISAESDTVNADPTQINQILLNLCTNAADAMRKEGGILEVALENAELDKKAADLYPDIEPGEFIKLTVSDSGHGIEAEIINRIFDPYFTTKEVGKGTGMGLAVAHGIVKNHGGAITVSSEIGKGTTFQVFLPTTENEPESEIERDTHLPQGSKRILFIDDEKDLVAVMQPMLENLGYKVTARTSSIEALEAFRNNPDAFDLVITDMTMPNMTGKDLAKELMTIRPDIPIILCTGFSEQIDERRAEEMGISAFVMKPVVMRQIANTIREVLGDE